MFATTLPCAQDGRAWCRRRQALRAQEVLPVLAPAAADVQRQQVHARARVQPLGLARARGVG